MLRFKVADLVVMEMNKFLSHSLWENAMRVNIRWERYRCLSPSIMAVCEVIICGVNGWVFINIILLPHIQSVSRKMSHKKGLNFTNLLDAIFKEWSTKASQLNWLFPVSPSFNSPVLALNKFLISLKVTYNLVCFVIGGSLNSARIPWMCTTISSTASIWSLLELSFADISLSILGLETLVISSFSIPLG